MPEWALMYSNCISVVQGSIMQWAWPDGRSLVEQPALTVELFAIMRDEFSKELAEQMRRDTN